jgi:hypothetical protein
VPLLAILLVGLGDAVVAGLIVVPLAVLAGRRLWVTFVLGGTLALLVVAVTPFLFGPLAEVLSLSQIRRVPFFLPIPFAIAGAALLAARLRLTGVAAAFGAGLAFRLASPGEFSYTIENAGPAWPVWVALAGGACALALGAVWRREPGSVWPHLGRARGRRFRPADSVAGNREGPPKRRCSRVYRPATGVRLRRRGAPGHVADTLPNRPKERVKE